MVVSYLVYVLLDFHRAVCSKHLSENIGSYFLQNTRGISYIGSVSQFLLHFLFVATDK